MNSKIICAIRSWSTVIYRCAALGTLFLFIFFVNGCGPTYPKEKLEASIIKICKQEYKVDVKVETIGKTIAIYLPLEDLLDFSFAVTASASEKINDVILSVSRVTLSTDAGYQFYCIIAHDIRIPELQIVIIKSVDDVKRFLLNDISRSEYSKRMLIDLRLSPQAQKEHAIKEVFEKMGLDKQWQDSVMNDFFRSAPAGLGDIGYWDDHFYIKDVALPEFLSEQIANRIRMEFREDKKLADEYVIKSSKGIFNSKLNQHYFRIEILTAPRWLQGAEAERYSDLFFKTTLTVAGNVIGGYKFTDFDYLEIVDQNSGKSLKVSKEDIEAFRKKKIDFKEILKKDIG